MRFTRRRTALILRSMLLVLAVVWSSVALHPCNFEQNATLASANDQPEHCNHRLSSDDGIDQAGMELVSCADLGSSAPDSRPPAADWLAVSWHPVRVLNIDPDSALRIPAVLAAAPPQPLTPLRLRYAELLI